jgi:hypothetical protein
LPEIGMLSDKPLPSNLSAAVEMGDEKAINNLMLDWVSSAYDANSNIDRLTPEEQAELFFTVVPGWLHCDFRTLTKLAHVAENLFLAGPKDGN